MINLKCTDVHYANLSPSSINKSFLNHGLLNVLFHFFRFLVYVYFNEAFVKNFIKELSFFNTSFETSFKDVVYHIIFGYQTL